MTEKEAGGAQQVAPVEEEQESQLESESVPEPDVEIPPDVLKQYEGKSPEELAKMHYSATKKMGEQGAKLGDITKTNESLAALIEELRAGREKQAEIPNPFQSPYERTQEVAPPVSREDELADDDFLTYGKVKELLGQKEKAAKTQQYQGHVQQTSTAFEKGRASMQKNPQLFEGIENDVATRVASSYMSVFQMFGDNPQVAQQIADELSNPETWDKTAKYVRIERKEFDRVIPDKTTPMAATHTETPSSVRPSTSTPAIELDMRDRDMAAFNEAIGKQPTTKDIEEIVKKGKESWGGTQSLSDINRRHG